MDFKALANMLLPDVRNTPEYYERLFPQRNLPDGAMVTRYAPSPTGFQHLGGVFAALVEERIAHQSGGVFYLRIEDTDRKREINGGTEQIINALASYNIYFDEGPLNDEDERGMYGPYKQSSREEIYKTYVKYMIENGNAYPCFCLEEEFEKVRKEQENERVRTGYYGKWAVCRNLSLDEVRENLRLGKKFIIRLKATGNWDKKIAFQDAVRGNIEMPENDQDIVILKSDGLPTYHFAHAVDDHLMRTTLVIRGEEWLPSTPVHLQIFDMLGFGRLPYAHISPVMKLDGSSKRKLSKRKDPEAAFSYYQEKGYPADAVVEYLLTIANSSFEDWRRQNPDESYSSFRVNIEKISSSGALFDIDKLTDISKNKIAFMCAEKVYESYLKWANRYDEEMAKAAGGDREYAIRIFSIDRNVEKPRKDYAKWEDVRNNIDYFYDELFNSNVAAGYDFPDKVTTEDVKNILERYISLYSFEDDKIQWFEKIRDMSEELGFTKDMKAYRKNPEAYKGNVGDVSTVIRVAITNKSITPDIYEIMQIMGKDRVAERLKNAYKSVK